MNTELESIRQRLWQEENCVVPLRECSNRMEIMRKKAKAAEAGDKNLDMREIFPKQYSWLAPLAAAYYDDRRGWGQFLRALRNESGWANKDPRWRRLHEFMRVAHTNASQFFARSMSGEAADLYLAAGRTFKKGDRTKYMDWCRQLWKEQRTAILKNARAAGNKERLPQDERQDLTDAFWDTIRTQLDHGQYPEPPENLFD